jgi:hypothetical protein
MAICGGGTGGVTFTVRLRSEPSKWGGSGGPCGPGRNVQWPPLLVSLVQPASRGRHNAARNSLQFSHLINGSLHGLNWKTSRKCAGGRPGLRGEGFLGVLARPRMPSGKGVKQGGGPSLVGNAHRSSKRAAWSENAAPVHYGVVAGLVTPRLFLVGLVMKSKRADGGKETPSARSAARSAYWRSGRIRWK